MDSFNLELEYELVNDFDAMYVCADHRRFDFLC